MMGTINCVYETPCSWCSKWDKKCDKQISERGQRVKINPVDDAAGDTIETVLINKMCQSDQDHEWECTGMSSAGSSYRCRKCGMYKSYPVSNKTLCEAKL